MGVDTLAQGGHGHIFEVVKASISKGDIVNIGDILGVALTDTTNTFVEVDAGPSIHSLPVDASDGEGDNPIAIGAQIYWDSTLLNADSKNGIAFGIALEAIASGVLATIRVLVQPSKKSRGKIAVVAGGAAGAHTVTGIKLGDVITGVLHFTTAAAIATVADLTSEFDIAADDAVDNTGGTSTSNDQLVIFYESRS